jgi:uncharacterized membrane protein
MNRFADVLNQVRDRLEIAEPSRTRIVLEMASDLEDSYQYFLDQGHDEAEATRLAKENFGTSEEALRHLTHVHRSGIGGMADRVSGQVGHTGARLLMLVLVVFEIWLAGVVLTEEAFRVYVSPFVWPIASLAVLAFAFTVWKLVQIFSQAGRDISRLRSGLGVLLFCSGASLAVAVCGLFFHLQRFFRHNFERAPESLFMNFAGWMVSISSMMTIGLLVAILAALVWFVLSSAVARAERREMETLLVTGA